MESQNTAELSRRIVELERQVQGLVEREFVDDLIQKTDGDRIDYMWRQMNDSLPF